MEINKQNGYIAIKHITAQSLIPKIRRNQIVNWKWRPRHIMYLQQPTNHMKIQTSTTKQVRDLDVLMSNTATFTIRIRNIVKKARDKMGWVLSVFQSWERSLMLTLLKSLVIPLLEYCCQLWNPWKAKDIQAIEAFQRTFTYKIIEEKHLKYWERLHELKLCSLQKGRERYIIVNIW